MPGVSPWDAKGTPFGCHHLKQLLTARLFVQQRHRDLSASALTAFSPHSRIPPPTHSGSRGNTGRGRWPLVLAVIASVAAHEPPGPPCNSSGG